MLPLERPSDTGLSAGVPVLSVLVMTFALVSTFTMCGFCKKKRKSATVQKETQSNDNPTAVLPFGDTKRANPLYRATVSEGSPSPDGAESVQSMRPKLNRENTASIADEAPKAVERSTQLVESNHAEAKAGYIQVADPADGSNRSSKSSIDSDSNSRSQLIKMSRSEEDNGVTEKTPSSNKPSDKAAEPRTTSAISEASSTASEDRAQKLARLKQQRAARLASQQEGLSEALALIDNLDEE
eukprot:m.202363 g.202363  ORF g.202363 m.202363 type:complete len:241 (-) comp18826_c0_seq4:169-891(-)